MKKQVCVLTAIFLLILSMSVNALEARVSYSSPSLTFDGTEAACKVNIFGASTSDKITATVKLWQGSTCLKTWSESGSGTLRFSETHSKGIEFGKTHKMTVKFLKKIFMLTLAFFILANTAFAASNSITWTDTSTSTTVDGTTYQAFYHKSGTLKVTYNPETTTTRIDFTYSANNVQNISEYMSSNCWYTGMDIKDNGFGFSAVTISTSLPNAKTDLGSNKGQYIGEADIVALDLVTANKNYYMSVSWNDYRPVNSGDKWYVNAELSKKGVFDYNTVAWRSCKQLAYGTEQGAV